jgi:hypothetical protein
MKEIIDALVYAVTYISLDGDEYTKDDRADTKALESIAYSLSKISESEKNNLAVKTNQPGR